jgi:uncharacterized lipoprotein YmbA
VSLVALCRSFALVLALGCGAVLPKSEKSAFFVLTALEPAPATSTASVPSVLLGPVVVPAYLDRRELVTRLGSNELRAEELELWAEPLRDSLPRTLEYDLAALLGAGRVQRLPWTAPAPPAIAVAVELRRFERTAAGQVEVEADWTVSERRGAGRVRRQTRLSLPAGASTQTAVASLSQALATLSREIANAVQQVTAPATARGE